MTSSSPPKKSFFRIPDSSLFSEPSTWVLLAVNLIPLFGVFFWGWDLFSLMVLYWMETAMIGFYQLIKILVTNPILALFLILFFTFHFGMFMKVHFLLISTLFGPPWAKELHYSMSLILDRLLFQEGFWIPALALFISHGISFFFHGFKAPLPTGIEALKEGLRNMEPPPEAARPVGESISYHSTEDWQHTIDSTPLKSLVSPPEKNLSPARTKAVLAVAQGAGNTQSLMFEPYKRIIVMHITIIIGGIISGIAGNSKAAILVMVAMKTAADLFSHANYHGLGAKAAPAEKALEVENA